MEKWQPKYMDHYFSIDKHKIAEIKQNHQKRYNIQSAIKRYMWIDLPDDFKLLKEGNVYHTLDDAAVAAMNGVIE